MNQNLLLKSNKGTVGVIRNPYERVIALYYQDLDYCGLDKWLSKKQPAKQVDLCKDCDYLIRFEDWKQELKDYELEVKDTSILRDEEIVPMWDRWYTLRTQSLVYHLYHEDITTYGYSF